MHKILAEYERRCKEWSDIQAHLPYLKETVEGFNEPVVVELGVRTGNSTAALLEGVASTGGHLWSVDIEPAVVPNEWHNFPYWTFLQGNDLDLVEVLPDSIDVLFIDTSHTYEQTLAELEAFVPRMWFGGVVLLHDTQLPGAGVRRALDDFGMKWSERDGSHGLGIIQLGEL